MATAQLSTEKKELIKALKKAANKAIAKIIASTFDTNERNRGMLLVGEVLQKKIDEVVAL